MLLIQGALIALFGGISGKGIVIELAICIQGMIFSILWYGVVYKGSKYVERWDRVVMQIETTLKERLGSKFFAIRHMNDAAKIYEKRGKFRIWGRTTKLMKITIITIGMFWIGMGVSTPFRSVNVEKGKTIECEINYPRIKCSSTNTSP